MIQIQDGEFELALFDLDGTLVDTAPDMVAVLQAMQQARNLSPIAYSLGRSYVSHGAVGLLSIGFEDDVIETGGDLHMEFLDRYADAICNESVLFDGLSELLDELDRLSCPWGIVTNKPEQLTLPLVSELGLADRSACTISGDTLPVRKPDPAPVLLACELADVEPEHTIYIGDADRDIEAGRRAGTATIAASYGYITAGDDPRAWDADIVAATPGELAQIVLKAVSLDA